jgi:hypothetical protein
LLERDRPKDEHQRIVARAVADVLGLVEIVVLEIADVRLRLLDVGGKAVFKNDAELHAEVIGLGDDRVGVGQQIGDVAVRSLLAVPIDHHAVDAGELHQQQVIFNHLRIVRRVRADLRVIVRSDLPLPVRIDDVGIAIVELPVEAPVRAAERRRRFEPGHVMHVDLHRVGLLHVRGRGECRASKTDKDGCRLQCFQMWAQYRHRPIGGVATARFLDLKNCWSDQCDEM